MTQEELNRILDDHQKWINGDGWKRADLRNANLCGANLCDANLCDADLCGANLCGANLRNADLDYSCWPLWCGSIGVEVDSRLARQLAYHFCRLRCDDPEYLSARNSIIEFANKFHRVGECGKLEVIEDE